MWRRGPSRRSVIIDQDHVIVRAHARPGLRHFTLDAEPLQQAFASVGIDVLPIEGRPAEAIGQQNRHIFAWRRYAAAPVGPTPLVREVVSELASTAFGTAALAACAST
jgi:hypothetical protein